GRDPATVRLEELMTRPLVFVDAGEGIDRVAEIMAEKGIRRVLVEKDGRVLGVIRNQTIVRRMRDYIDSISAQIARAQLPPLGRDRSPRGRIGRRVCLPRRRD